jgi:hypothetical protein
MKYLFLPMLLIASMGPLSLSAQKDTTDLLKLIGGPVDKDNFTVATFKGTRLINFHTIEVPGRNTLDFRISHRFGPFNGNWYNFYGLDGGASIRLGLEYSYDGRLEVGIGRTSLDKMADGFLKYRLIRQRDSDGSPLSVTLFSGAYYTMLKDPNATTNGFDKYQHFGSRFSFAHQIIVGRKFSERLSLQIAPVLVHVNQVDRISDKNDAFVIAGAGRFKITQRSAITMEYGFRVFKYTQSTYYNTFSIGYDIETGGHVFQMFVTNSLGLTENQFLTRTDTKWSNAGIRLGFNISRVFTIGGKKEAKW